MQKGRREEGEIKPLSTIALGGNESTPLTEISPLLSFSLSSSMRLDLFLKASRLVLRRTVAQELCDAGAVFVNGLKAKSAREIKVGDEVEIKKRNRVTKVKVLQVPTTKQVSRSQVPNLYEVISGEVLEEEF
jgi:ribosomal 50S subunit-recycling heat shock protein